jgi:hypothetical protein
MTEESERGEAMNPRQKKGRRSTVRRTNGRDYGSTKPPLIARIPGRSEGFGLRAGRDSNLRPPDP